MARRPSVKLTVKGEEFQCHLDLSGAAKLDDAVGMVDIVPRWASQKVRLSEVADTATIVLQCSGFKSPTRSDIMDFIWEEGLLSAAVLNGLVTPCLQLIAESLAPKSMEEEASGNEEEGSTGESE